MNVTAERLKDERNALRVSEAYSNYVLADEQLCKLESLMGSLEGYQTLLEQSLEDNGEIPRGLEASFRLTLESVWGTDSSVAQTEFTQEGMKEVMGVVGQALANAKDRASRRTKDAFSALFEGNKTLVSRAKALKTAVDKLDASQKPSDKTFVINGISRLHMDGDTSPKAIADGFVDGAKKTSDVIRTSSGFAQTLIDIIMDAREAVANLDDEPSKEDVIEIQERAMKSSDRAVRSYQKDMRYGSTVELPGGQVLAMVLISPFKIRDASDKEWTEIEMPLRLNTNAFGRYKEKDAVQTPSVPELQVATQVLGDYVESMNNDGEELKILVRELGRMRKDAKFLSKILKRLGITPFDNLNDIVVKTLAWVIDCAVGHRAQRWAAVIEGGQLEMAKYQYSACRAGLEYCEKTLALYEGKK